MFLPIFSSIIKEHNLKSNFDYIFKIHHSRLTRYFSIGNKKNTGIRKRKKLIMYKAITLFYGLVILLMLQSYNIIIYIYFLLLILPVKISSRLKRSPQTIRGLFDVFTFY